MLFILTDPENKKRRLFAHVNQDADRLNIQLAKGADAPIHETIHVGIMSDGMVHLFIEFDSPRYLFTLEEEDD